MKTQTSMVKKIVITDIPNLDNVAVYLEDYEEGKGKITITCFNKSWTYYWGCMGECNLTKFIIGCDNHYLSGKLNPNVDSDVYDEEGFENYAKEHVIRRRKERCLSKEEARESYDRCFLLAEYKEFDSKEYAQLMYDIFGDDWYDCSPKKPNPEYSYFCRILDVIKEALRNE